MSLAGKYIKNNITRKSCYNEFTKASIIFNLREQDYIKNFSNYQQGQFLKNKEVVIVILKVIILNENDFSYYIKEITKGNTIEKYVDESYLNKIK